MSRIADKIYIFEIIAAILMILGTLPQEFSYVIIPVVAWGFYKTALIDSLGLFIVSIPFFTALPGNQFSDSMSTWRILIVILFLKAAHETKPVRAKALTFQNPTGALRKLIRNLANKSYGKLFLFFSIFIIVNILSLAEAENVMAGIKKILFDLNIALLFPIVHVAVKNREDVERVLKYLLKCSIAVVFVGYFQLVLSFFVPLFKFWQFWTGSVIKVFYGQKLSELLSYSNTWFSYYDVLPATLRMFSVFPDSHSFSMFMLLSLPITLYFMVVEKEKAKNRIILLAILSLMALFFSGSRGVWASSIGAVAIGSIYFINPRARFNGIAGFMRRMKAMSRVMINTKIIFVSVIVFFLMIPIAGFILRKNQEVQLAQVGSEMKVTEEEAMFKRIISISNLSEESNMGRIEIWDKTIRSINTHYFFGIGAGNFPLILKNDLTEAKKGSSAHSIYLDIAAETGVVGLLAFTFVILEIMTFSFGLYSKDFRQDVLKILAGAFFVYFSWISFYGFFDVVIFNDKVLMYLVLIVAVLYAAEGTVLKKNRKVSFALT